MRTGTGKKGSMVMAINKLRLLTVILTVMLISPNALLAVFSGGSGTEESPYLITSEDELDAVRYYPDAHFLQTTDIHLTETFYPIPLFKGVYDGGGNYIYNLSIRQNKEKSTGRPEVNHYYDAGLFETLLEGSSLLNIRLKGGFVEGSNNVGGIVGSNEGGTIAFCSVVELTVTGGKDAGGLVGSNFGTIKESYAASVSVTGRSSSSTQSLGDVFQTAGGLAGTNYGGIIKNSYSTADVTGEETVGGLTGNNTVDGLIKNCYAAGKVISLDGNADTGGITGRNIYASVTGSYWDIEASGQEESAGGEGVTTVKMMQEASFENWDFEEIWNISEWYDDDPPSSYPYLVWQEGDDPHYHNVPTNKDPLIHSFDVDENNRWFWVSFPWLSRDAIDFPLYPDRQTAEEVLRPLAAEGREYIDYVKHWNVRDYYPDPATEIMDWNYDNNIWDPDQIQTFCSTLGYKVRFGDVPDDTYELPAYGTRVSSSTGFQLFPTDPAGENWVGYFITIAQCASAAFNLDLENGENDDIMWIRTESGSIRWKPEDNMYVFEDDPILEYGKMCKVALRGDVEEPIWMYWHVPRTPPADLPDPKPQPEHFVFSKGPDYQSLFIEEITEDEDVAEIGVYAGEHCIGASVFRGRYPVEILAYTNEAHLNESLTFVLYLQDGGYERHETVLVGDWEASGYSREVIRPLEDKFTLVKIDRSQGRRGPAVEEDDDVVLPEISLNQSYPNPFRIGGSPRYRSNNTNIPFFLPETMPVDLKIYNIRGQLVRTLVSGKLDSGEYVLSWDGTDTYGKKVSTGIYFYRLETAEIIFSRKMMLIR